MSSLALDEEPTQSAFHSSLLTMHCTPGAGGMDATCVDAIVQGIFFLKFGFLQGMLFE